MLLLVTPSDAASRGELHAKDLVGDANGINGQGFNQGLGGMSTSPASIAGADIARLDVTTRFKTVKGKRQPKATVVTLSLSGPVQTGVNFVITANSSHTCDGTSKRIQLGYQNQGVQTLRLAICQKSGGTNSETIGFVEENPAKGKISWVLDMGQKPGHTLTGFDVSSTAFVLGVFDQLSPTGTFTFAR